MYKYVKALAALLGGLSPIAVAGVLTILRVPVDPTEVIKWSLIASPVLSYVSTFFAPPNAAEKAAEDAEAEKLGKDADSALAELGARLAPKK